jgi:hypothetical protein
MTCPFCGDTDFDEIGLKRHLTLGWCDEFGDVPDGDPPKIEESR